LVSRVQFACGMKRTWTTAMLSSVLGLAACGSDPATIAAPHFGAIVNDSLPPSLRPGATTPRPRLAPANDPPEVLAALAAQYIQNMFQDHYPNDTTMMSSPGYLDAQISHIQTRLRGVDGSTRACLDAANVNLSIDLSSTLDTAARIVLPLLQCADPFHDATGAAAADGSGLVFGNDDNGHWSLWTAVGAMGGTDFATTGGFLSFANVTDGESVDALLLSYGGPNSQPNAGFGQVVRFKANATAQTFEMFYAENGGDLKGVGTTDGDVWLGGGTRMISDGTHIYADGVIYNLASSAEGYQPFTACIAAATMTVDTTAGACDTLATTFTLSTTASLDYCDIVGTGAGCTLPGPGQEAPMGSAQIQAIDAVFPVTAAPAGVGTF
jgi:hypothetical protein